jgi:bla regulator protein BlaR1
MLTEIVNHLWQSTLIAAVIAALMGVLRDYGAHVRYWLWWAASVKFLLPFSLLALLGSALRRTDTPLVDLAGVPATLGAIAEPMPDASGGTPLALVLLGLWIVGFGGVLGRWAARASKVRTLLRFSVPYSGALPLAAGAGPEVRVSAALVEPALVGVFQPVLLLPAGIGEVLTRTQLEAVVAHELSHWRRGDNLTAAVHMLVEAALWFHPLVWWIGARLIEERERACDETVVREGHDGRAYAESILNVCERYVASRLDCVAGVSGADLKRRVVEIARNKVMSVLPIEKELVLGTFALATVLVPVVFGVLSGRTEAQSSPGTEPRPLVRINPNYPPEALAAGLAGEVSLEFTIAANGMVKDVVVVDSSAPMFEEPAIAALLKWRYLPTNVECVGPVCTPIENAEAVERPGMRTVLRFELACVPGAPTAQPAFCSPPP